MRPLEFGALGLGLMKVGVGGTSTKSPAFQACSVWEAGFRIKKLCGSRGSLNPFLAAWPDGV